MARERWRESEGERCDILGTFLFVDMTILTLFVNVVELNSCRGHDLS